MTDQDSAPAEDFTSVPIGMVAHWQFCPRRAWLESVGERAEYSGQMAEGVAAHERVDEPTTKAAAVIRAMDVRHEALGFHDRGGLLLNAPPSRAGRDR